MPQLPSSRGATGLGSRLSGMGLGSSGPVPDSMLGAVGMRRRAHQRRRAEKREQARQAFRRSPIPELPLPESLPTPEGKALGGGIGSLMMNRGGEPTMAGGRPIQWQQGPVGQQRRQDFMNYMAPRQARRQLGRQAAAGGPGRFAGRGAGGG